MTAHIGHMAHMVLMGLLVSVIAPLLLLALVRIAPRAERWTVPAVVQLVLLLSAVLFWAPVLGSRHRLPDAGRTVYLYTAMPLLDLAGVWRVIVGDSAGGLSMIVGMLPMGFAAVVVTWRWINREERNIASEAREEQETATARTTVDACVRTGEREFHREPEC